MKAKLAFFLALTFVSFITTPLVIQLIDDAKEIVASYDLSEEENNNEFENDIDLELKYNYLEFSINHNQSTKNNSVLSVYYILEPSSICTPPPEFVL